MGVPKDYMFVLPSIVAQIDTYVICLSVNIITIHILVPSSNNLASQVEHYDHLEAGMFSYTWSMFLL